MGGAGHGTTQIAGEKLHAVADTEDRKAQIVDRRVNLWSLRSVDACGTTREDDPLHGPVSDDLAGLGCVRQYLGKDPALTHASGNDLRVLGSKIEDDDLGGCLRCLEGFWCFGKLTFFACGFHNFFGQFGQVWHLGRKGKVESGLWAYWRLLEVIPKLATHVALHHLFGIQLPFTFKPLNGCVGDIIDITLSCGATGQTEGGDYYKDGGEKNSEKIHPATLKDPIQKAIREAGSTTRRGWHLNMELRNSEKLRG